MDSKADAQTLSSLARALHEEREAEPTARAIIDQARVIVPDVMHASLTVRAAGGTYKSLGSSSSVADKLDELQYTLDEGPCVEVVREGGWYRSGDVGRDERWPRWGPEAAAAGVHSLLCVRLVARDDLSGAINLYSEERGGFAERDAVDRALLWATHAASALAAAQEVSGLETALSSRHLIGMAQGRVMERFGLTEDQSFTLLCRVSSHRNEKLRDVAEGIVRTGDIPRASARPQG